MLPVRRCAERRGCCGLPGNPGSPKLPVFTRAAAVSAACCAPALAAPPCRCCSSAAAAAAAASAAAVSSKCACSSAHCCLSRLVNVGTERSSSRPLMISWNSLAREGEQAVHRREVSRRQGAHLQDLLSGQAELLCGSRWRSLSNTSCLLQQPGTPAASRPVHHAGKCKGRRAHPSPPMATTPS